MAPVVSPNVGQQGKSMEEIVEERKRNRLPEKMYELIRSVLVAFEYDEGKVADVTRHILNSDADVALEDCVPMKAWFGMCANKFEEKEEVAKELIKILTDSQVTGEKGKTTAQKAAARMSEEYKKLVAKRIRYCRLKQNCRVLEEAMEMRANIAQTKNKNLREGMHPSSYVNINR